MTRRCLFACFAAAALAPPSFGAEPAAPALPPVSMELPERVEWPVIVSADGKLLATRSKQRQASVYDLRKKKELYTLEMSFGNLFAFTPNGKHLITQRGNNKPRSDRWTVDVRAAATGKVLRSFDLLERHGLAPGGHYAVADDTLIVVGRDLEITVYDLTKGAHYGDLPNKDHVVHKLALSPDGKWLVTAGGRWDWQLRIWDVEKLALLNKHEFGRERPTALAVSPDGKWWAAATKGREAARLWVGDLVKGTPKANTLVLTPKAEDLFFTPDGQTLCATGWGANHGLSVWDWQSSKQPRGVSISKAEEVIEYLAWADKKKWNTGSLCGCTMTAAGVLVTLDRDGIRLWPDLSLPVNPEPPKKKSKPKK
jgi:WD40 repeat protein